MNDCTRYFFLGMIICLLTALSARAQTETIVNVPHRHASSDIDAGARYQIVETAAGNNNIFRFDRVCGDTELLALNRNQAWAWDTLPVPDIFPCTNDSRSHYQLFSSAQGGLVLLMNTDTKTTWRFDAQHMAWLHM